VDSVAEHLREAQLFVLPSRHEGFGIAAAEALASGVPALTTPSGGPEELVRASGGGVVLEGFTAEELAEGAVELLGDAARLLAMRASGREYVAREHSSDRFRAMLAAAFVEVGG
jgi:phosphatidylinositol alpha 1,6-mannosyltransferase